MKKVTKDQATALRIMVHEYAHAQSCQAAYRARATYTTGLERESHMACADHWAGMAQTAKANLAELGVVLP